MPIEFRCAHCGKLLRTPDNSAGKKGKCPHCQGTNEIPLSSTAPGAPAAPGGGGDLFSNLPTSTPFPSPTSPADQFGKPPAAGGAAPNIYSNAPSAPAAPHAPPDLFSDLPGPTTFPTSQDDPLGPGPGLGGGLGGSSPGGFGGAGGGFAPKPAPRAAANPYSAPSYAASQSSYGGGMQPHRGGMVLTLGIIAVVSALVGGAGGCCCCLFMPLDVVALAVGIPAAILGHIDLKKIKEGYMDPSGQGMTMTGYIMGIVSCVLVLLSVLLFVVALIFNIGLQGMQGMQPNQNFNF